MRPIYKPIWKMSAAELEAVADDDSDPRRTEAERELEKREQAGGDPRVAQGTGNAFGELAS